MRAVLVAVLKSFASVGRSRTALQIEVLALRRQLARYQHAGRRPRIRPPDRARWAWLSRVWSGWQATLVQRLQPLLRPLDTSEPATLVPAVVEDVKRYAGAAAQNDDITVLAIRKQE